MPTRPRIKSIGSKIEGMRSTTGEKQEVQKRETPTTEILMHTSRITDTKERKQNTEKWLAEKETEEDNF